MYNFGSFDAFIVKPTILPEICSTIIVNYARLFYEDYNFNLYQYFSENIHINIM